MAGGSGLWSLVVDPGVRERARRLGGPPFLVSILVFPI